MGSVWARVMTTFFSQKKHVRVTFPIVVGSPHRQIGECLRPLSKVFGKSPCDIVFMPPAPERSQIWLRWALGNAPVKILRQRFRNGDWVGYSCVALEQIHQLPYQSRGAPEI